MAAAAAGMGMPNQAMMAAQWQMLLQQQQQEKIKLAVQNGSLTEPNFATLMHDLHTNPQDQGPGGAKTVGTGAPGSPDAARADELQAQLEAHRAAQTPQQAQFEMMSTDQKQAQTIFTQIKADSDRYNSLLDRAVHGKLPDAQIKPEEAAQMKDLYAKIQSGKATPGFGMQPAPAQH
jgi:hypothetical protein